jgi:CheY-like chemotaxis protein
MKTILVIDDDILIRQLMQTMLNSYGFNTITAENGAIGLQSIEEHIPDLIICDFVMPELNGYRVLKAVREDPNTSKIPFIFLSASPDPGIRDLGIILGANHYLTKPFLPKELLDVIFRYLNN